MVWTSARNRLVAARLGAFHQNAKLVTGLAFMAMISLTVGCGEAETATAPSSSELQRYLAEHPELNEVQEPDEFANKNRR